LALAQAGEAKARLALAHPELAAPDAIEIVVIRTTGDSVQDRRLADIGGKGLFTKEIDEALLQGHIDLAHHSMKDVPTWLPDGIAVAALLPREDPRDAWIAREGKSLAELPRGATVGTASLRRTAQLKARRGDLSIVPLRGNVDTRLRKLAAGEVDATVLALAGLKRLGMADRATHILSADEMLPAVAQGAIGLACRADDRRLLDWLAPLDDAGTRSAVTAERAMLAVLDGSCRTPIAGLAEPDRTGGLSLRGLIALPDGGQVVRAVCRGPSSDCERLGRDVGEELRRNASPRFFEGR
jgi:hydroxymethylbilane synthase